MPTFLRRAWNRYPKLGKGRKKKQKWKKPTGRDNKMREKRKGYPAVVQIGYGKKREEKGLIGGIEPIKINTIKDLEKVGKDQIAILGKMGKKKKIEVVKLASEKKIQIVNLKEKTLERKNEFKQ